MNAAWSEEEVQLIVADYFDMLSNELQGEKYNKTEHRNAIKKLLNGRSKGSIEKKHQNISAVLRELNVPPIDGYKPLGNYQMLLFDVVSKKVGKDDQLKKHLVSTIEGAVKVPSVGDILRVLERPPKRPSGYSARTRVSTMPGSVDYIGRESGNVELGAKGEEFIMNYEKARLVFEGKNALADKIDQVSLSEGPSAGFDIRSFEINGNDRLIEVKTTSYGRYTPFYVTKNELLTSVQHPKSYHLYRLFLFRSNPRLFILPGQLDRTTQLDATLYMSRVG